MSVVRRKHFHLALRKLEGTNVEMSRTKSNWVQRRCGLAEPGKNPVSAGQQGDLGHVI